MDKLLTGNRHHRDPPATHDGHESLTFPSSLFSTIHSKVPGETLARYWDADGDAGLMLALRWKMFSGS